MPLRTLCALLLLSGLACGQPVPEGGWPVLSQPGLEALVVEATRALERGPGLRLLRPVPAVLLTAEQALARRKAFAATLPEGSGATAGFELLADLVFSESMVGRYLPDEKVLYVIEDVVRRHRGDGPRARDYLFGVVAHELVHAHDDQVYGNFPDPIALLERMKDGDLSELPSLQVTMSLLEGHATYAAELACAAAGVPPLPAMTMDDVRSSGAFKGGDNVLVDGLAAAGNAVARLKAVQYVQGREFSKAAMDFGGEAFMAEVFRSLPLTAEELADFGRFKLRWAEQREAELEAAEAGAGG